MCPCQPIGFDILRGRVSHGIIPSVVLQKDCRDFPLPIINPKVIEMYAHFYLLMSTVDVGISIRGRAHFYACSSFCHHKVGFEDGLVVVVLIINRNTIVAA